MMAMGYSSQVPLILGFLSSLYSLLVVIKCIAWFLVMMRSKGVFSLVR
jgi:hypothetical protein